ncbi:MAG: AsmA family protein, partial [Bacteroidales bacterium]|nr:AsmA family protein [Bacteroidales bacterium]
MKKFFKIFGITLGSIVGLLLIVVCIVLWLVFTPERITKIVNDNVDKFLNAEVHLDRAELTFFSSFPRFMVKINNIDVINPLGLENDTVVHTTAIALDVNVKELLKNHNLIVEEAIINDAKIFAYSDSNICNYNIVKSSEEDTTASSFVINNIVVQNVTLKNSNIVFFDKSTGINAKLVNTNANLGIAMHDSSSMDLQAKLQTDDLFFALDTTIYANNIPADMSAQFTYDFVNSKFILPECALKSGDNLLKTHLVIDLADSTKTGLDIHFSLNAPDFPKMMAICPPDYKSYADGFDIQGALDVHGTVKGNVSDKEYPLVDLQLNTYHLQVAADFLPDTLRDIALTANILVDMNVEKN